MPDVLSRNVAVALTGIRESAKEGLLALAVQVGLQTMAVLFEEEVTQKVGPKGKHNADRGAVRHGYEDGEVVLGGRKARVRRPRARTTEGTEVELETYAFFQDEDVLAQAALERMIHGLSTRRYNAGLEPVGSDVESHSTSKSMISARFIRMTEQALQELLNRPLGELNLVVLYIDGVVVAEHTVIVAIGVDVEGHKHLLGVWEGASENAAACKQLLSNLVERGLDPQRGLLVVIDGSKALRKAVSDVLGTQVLVQRCQVHKMRNVLEHLPKDRQAFVKRKLQAAWAETDASKAETALQSLATALEKEYPGAAASLREGLAETLTVNRLRISVELRRTLRSTNPIESAIEVARTTARRVKRWRNGSQVLRWTAAGLLEAEKRFHKVQGYRALPQLRAELLLRLSSDTTIEAASA